MASGNITSPDKHNPHTAEFWVRTFQHGLLKGRDGNLSTESIDAAKELVIEVTKTLLDMTNQNHVKVFSEHVSALSTVEGLVPRVALAVVKLADQWDVDADALNLVELNMKQADVFYNSKAYGAVLAARYVRQAEQAKQSKDTEASRRVQVGLSGGFFGLGPPA